MITQFYGGGKGGRHGRGANFDWAYANARKRSCVPRFVRPKFPPTLLRDVGKRVAPVVNS